LQTEAYTSFQIKPEAGKANSESKLWFSLKAILLFGYYL